MKKTKDYGLIGYPLGHSLSPFIHEEIFKKNGLRHHYSLYEIPPEELESKQHLLSSLDGFNVTIPLKELIIPLCEKLDKSAEFGAVNCVKDKTGYNTDIFGFEKSIKALGANLKSRVCLLGYGGAGKMVAHAVQKAGGRLTIAEKDSKKLKTCQAKANLVKTGDLKGDFDLLINSTPVGMYPKIKAAPIDFKHVKANFVLDLVYNPVETKLLTLAKEKGAKTMNGLVMLVWQAIRSHDIWYGGKLTDKQAEEIIAALQVKA
ncbi:MAG: shikimate dehydrogenase [Oscillospiraceae bacterium]|nr:shikimate dehydrogenase [Oscillospiraceae bacterium]